MMSEYDQLGDPIRDVRQLEDLLSEPTDGVVATMGRLEGDILILGVGGKIGPTLARMARRASDAAGVKRRIIGVDKLEIQGKDELEAAGIETLRCDLLKADQVASLPDAENIVYMAAMKFGTTGQTALTWAINTGVPVMVAQRYGGRKIVTFSTGNVYGLTPVEKGGSLETDELNPVGEYAQSTVGREQIFEHYSRALNTPMAIIRLNYANEMRYGVLVDMAQNVWNEQPIDLSMGHVNVTWQGDAIAMTLRAFDHVAVPPAVFNVVGSDTLRVRDVCEKLGSIMGRKPHFVGEESPDALLSNGSHGWECLGCPRVDVDWMLPLIADWVKRGGENLGKPTHFESRDGKF